MARQLGTLLSVALCVKTATTALPTYDLAIEAACAAKVQRNACLDSLTECLATPPPPPAEGKKTPWWVWPLVGVAFGGGVAVGVAASQ